MKTDRTSLEFLNILSIKRQDQRIRAKENAIKQSKALIKFYSIQFFCYLLVLFIEFSFFKELFFDKPRSFVMVPLTGIIFTYLIYLSIKISSERKNLFIFKQEYRKLRY